MSTYSGAAKMMLQHRYGFEGRPSDRVGSRAWVANQLSNQVTDRLIPREGDVYDLPIDMAHEALFGSMPMALRGRVELSPVLAPGQGTGAIRMIPLQSSPQLSAGASEGVDLGFQEFLRDYRGQYL